MNLGANRSSWLGSGRETSARPAMVGAVLLLVPAFLRNGVYDLIAHNRYRLFGKKESCMLPTPETRSRFLSE